MQFKSWPIVDDEHVEAVERVVRSGRWHYGSIHQDLERDLETEYGRHAVTTTSCAWAIYLTIRALGRIKTVAVPAFTYYGTVHPVIWSGASPVFVDVDPNGSKRWLLRTVVQGRRRDIGLGSARLVSLAEAREKATAYRKIAREGGDPIADRKRDTAVALTFAECARRVHTAHAPGWRNQKHASQWLATLERYAFPHFGDRPVGQVDSSDVLRALSEIWLSKPETARRVRQRIRMVFDYAKAAGHRGSDNPVDGVTRALPRQTDRAKHHTALPYASIPEFIASLDHTIPGEPTRLALKFLIGTASRTGEVLGARWAEIDWETMTWTVPAERMKARREHRVPLSPMMIAVLKRARQLSGTSEFLFPGRVTGRPMSNMAMLQALRRMKVEATAHGFRSTFRDWAAEQTNFSREVCEMALAHTIKSKAEAAYRRGDLLEKRRALMAAWALHMQTYENSTLLANGGHADG